MWGRSSPVLSPVLVACCSYNVQQSKTVGMGTSLGPLYDLESDEGVTPPSLDIE